MIVVSLFFQILFLGSKTFENLKTQLTSSMFISHRLHLFYACKLKSHPLRLNIKNTHSIFAQFYMCKILHVIFT